MPLEKVVSIPCKECGTDVWDKIEGYENMYECTGCSYPEVIEENLILAEAHG